MQAAKIISIYFLLVLFMGGCTTGQTVFDKGKKFELEGNYDQALIKYAEASTANPEKAEFRIRLLQASAEAARRHLTKGDEFLDDNKYDNALQEYQTAFTLDSSLERARQQSDLAAKLKNSQAFFKEGEEFEKNNKIREAIRSYKKSLEFNSANDEAKEGVERLTRKKRSKLDGFELNLKSNKPITLKFKDAKIKDVFYILTQLSGINFIFDDAVKDTNFSIFLENATFQQALDVITELNKLGIKIINESSIIIFPKNAEKKKQYEELLLQTFYLNKIDAKKAVNLLRTMMQIKKIYVNEELNALVIRDTPEVVELAGKILEANDIPDAEVILEVEVMELTRSNAENLGFVLSKYQLSMQGYNNNVPFSDVLNATTTTSAVAGITGTTNTTTAATPSSLLQMFAWRQFSGFLTVPNATFNFAKTLANGETLANPKIRVKNKEKAKFNVGTRVPITTTSSPTGGGINVNVQYVDVGVKLNAEPTIQLTDEITIKLGMEVSSIINRETVGGTGSATTVVTIGTRNLDTVLSLKDGETSIIGGLIQDSQTKSKQKIALLGDIPIIGSIFSENDSNNQKTELVLAITPHIVRSMVVPDPEVVSFWSGKEDEPSVLKRFSSFAVDNEPQESGTHASGQAPAPQQPQGMVSSPVAAPAAQPTSTQPMTPGSSRRGGRAIISDTKGKPSPVIPASPQRAFPGTTLPSAEGPQPTPAVQPSVFPGAQAVPTAPFSGTAAPTQITNVPSQNPAIMPAPLPLPASSQGQTVPGVTPVVAAPSLGPVSSPTMPAQQAVGPQPTVGPTTVPAAPGVTGANTASAAPVASSQIIGPIPQNMVKGQPLPAEQLPKAGLSNAAPAGQSQVSGKALPQPALPPPLEEDIKSRKKIILKLAAPKIVKVKEEFSIDLAVSEAVNMYNGVIILEYDPVRVDFVKATEGLFLKKDGKPTQFNAKLKKEKASISLNVNRVGNVGGVSGGGPLATITFMSKSKGLVDIGVHEAYILEPGANVPMIVNLPRETVEIK